VGVCLLLWRNAGRIRAMRILALILLTLFATPALAKGWDHYDNARFGYGVDVPAGFEWGGESQNGDGQSFYRPRGAQGLLVWGGNMQGDFESEVTTAMDYAVAENGWNISYQAVTPRWASFSGVKGQRILYQRMVLLCDGTSYAAFRAEYSAADLTDMNPVVEHMVQSLRSADC
jgi:hypothetical protein